MRGNEIAVGIIDMKCQTIHLRREGVGFLHIVVIDKPQRDTAWTRIEVIEHASARREGGERRGSQKDCPANREMNCFFIFIVDK